MLASQYRADGYLVVRQVFSADRIAELGAEADRLRQRSDLIDTDNIRCRWQNDVNTGECRFDCFDPVIDLSAVCERTARDPRLLDIVGDAVRRARLSVQGQTDLQVPRHAGLQPASGLHLLEVVPDLVPDRDRRHRRRRRGQRGDRSLSRLPPAGVPHASGRHVPPTAGRCGGSLEGRRARSGAGRHRASSAATRRIAPGRTDRHSGAGCSI